MPIPFPGMNPYLEHPELWPEVHQKLMIALADTLQHQLASDYQVRSQERHYQVSGEDALVVGSPGLDWTSARSPVTLTHTVPETVPEITEPYSPGTHASPSGDSNNSHSQNEPISVLIPVPQKISETYLEIVDNHGSIVTIIEALSPKKKRPGRGRMLYERQREAIFGSAVHFVEIDLLRGWEPPAIYGPDEAGDYRILISRSEQRPHAQLYTWNVKEPIPPITLPLIGRDELWIDLKLIVDQAGDRIDLLVNYQQAPLPPLRHTENQWLEGFLQAVGMRPPTCSERPMIEELSTRRL